MIFSKITQNKLSTIITKPINKGLDAFSIKKKVIFAIRKTEGVAQLVRASVCGTEGRGFETPRSPFIKPIELCFIGF